jgi:hypothetical protein
MTAYDFCSFSQLKTSRSLSSKLSKPNSSSSKRPKKRNRRLSMLREKLNRRRSSFNQKHETLLISATLIGEALKQNPAYLKLQRIEIGKRVSKYIAQSPNKVIFGLENENKTDSGDAQY